MKTQVYTLARQFCSGRYANVTDSGLWRDTFDYLSSVEDDTIFQKAEIAALWVTYGGDLRARIKDDALILAVLKKALPAYQGGGLTLYRGESWFLFDQDALGFCWTSTQALAERYAKGLNAVESGGVLLKCHAPAEAILAAPALSGHTYICDPGKLLRLTTLALFPKP